MRTALMNHLSLTIYLFMVVDLITEKLINEDGLFEWLVLRIIMMVDQ